MYLAQVKKQAESKYPWDYFAIKATIPAAEAFQPLASVNCPMLKK
jgi:branched-chain amino acid transport system substrate-binding protein